MATKDDFTPDEWALIYWAPKAASGAVIEADMTVVSAARETLAVMKAGHAAREKYKSNAIIVATIPSAPMKGETPPPEPNNPFMGLNQDQCVAKVKEAVTLMQTKAPSEAAEYKQFVIELADLAANASGEGWFGTGQRVSEKEAAFLNKLKSALA